MVFGISIVQLCESPHAFYFYDVPQLLQTLDIYHVSFPNDRILIRASVYTIFVLDIFQSTVAASEAWQFLVAGWGRQINLAFPGWTFTALPIVSSFSACFLSADDSLWLSLTSICSLSWSADVLCVACTAAGTVADYTHVHHRRTC